VWGRDHPEKNTNPAKVKWSDEELDFIRIWISINTTEGTRNPIARCLDTIKINPRQTHLSSAPCTQQWETESRI
jgi:hypothetical protein